MKDTINGEEGVDKLYGYGGDDTISGGIGDDILQGLPGNDRLDGGDGNDLLAGDQDEPPNSVLYGADILKGGPGNDRLFARSLGAQPGTTPLMSDGNKDVLDCGDGNDSAWGNVSADQDEFRNCEVVNSG